MSNNNNNANNVLNTFVRAQMNKWNTRLMMYCELYQWRMVLIRLGTHPHEVAIKSHNGKTPLHVACGSHAAKIIVHSLSSACPQAVSMVDSNGMTPLHVACSSRNACPDSIRCLLRWVTDETMIQDLDGDTPLHVACRVGAPMEVLKLLLDSNPTALLVRDQEDLTPMQRLWVRHFVRLGEEPIRNISKKEDFSIELWETWEKTELLLRYLYKSSFATSSSGTTFRVVHAAVANDCPRDIVRIATCLYPHQLLETDDFGRRPASVAAMAPLFKVHDLTFRGYSYINGVGHVGNSGPDTEASNSIEPHLAIQMDGTIIEVPSVLEILVKAEPSVACEDWVGPSFSSPLLHLALVHGKGWNDGVKSIVEANPDAVSVRDSQSGLMPFMLAAASSGGSLMSPAHQITTILELLKRAPELVIPCSIDEIEAMKAFTSRPKRCPFYSSSSGAIDSSSSLSTSHSYDSRAETDTEMMDKKISSKKIRC